MDTRVLGYSDTVLQGFWIQGYMDTGIQGYKDTYRDTWIHGYRVTGIQGYMNNKYWDT